MRILCIPNTVRAGIRTVQKEPPQKTDQQEMAQAVWSGNEMQRILLPDVQQLMGLQMRLQTTGGVKWKGNCT
jgi:hypothetical protein